MSLIGGSTDYRRTDSPKRRQTMFSWMTGLPYSYYETEERTYEWATDSLGYTGSLINPDGLSGTWVCLQHGDHVPRGKPHGQYIEVWQQIGSTIYL